MSSIRRSLKAAVFFNHNLVFMTINSIHKLAVKHLAQNHKISRKQAYAEQRLIMATDRYIAANTTDSKEKARRWMNAWRALRTSRYR